MITTRNVIATVFLTLSLVAVVFLATSTSNYVEFYRAMEKFEMRLRNVDVVVIEDNVKVNITFEMSNPTNYVGLSLREWSYLLRLEANNENLDLSYDTISYIGEPITITPHWTQTFEHNASLYATRPSTSRFLELYNLYQEKEVGWTLQVHAVLLTFMGTMGIPMSSPITSEL